MFSGEKNLKFCLSICEIASETTFIHLPAMQTDALYSTISKPRLKSRGNQHAVPMGLREYIQSLFGNFIPVRSCLIVKGLYEEIASLFFAIVTAKCMI